MLKAQELRIGNWYKQDMINGDYAQITVSDIAELIDDPLDDFYQPIPLTEGWLVKFGFEKDSEDIYHYNFFKASFIADNPMWFGQSGCCQDETIKENIKYVHELQNLYYALTNQELTCN